MLFNSLDFVLFFPAVVALFFALPHRARVWFLLGASYVFYGAWDARYLLLLALSTVVDYTAGLAMARHETRRRRRPWLLLSLTVNLGLLGVFKYSGMFATTANALFGWLSLPYEMGALDVLLPVGISFYTFQTLAYSIDVYRGKQEAERHLGYFALYVSYFPQLVAGPIERSEHLLPQLRERKAFDYDRVASGLRIMMGGFLMKLVIADRVAPFTHEVFQEPGVYHGWAVILTNYFFVARFYCDFAGYSLIAIGAAKVMGHTLMNNFDRPFFSTSISEFWRRFHISLMTWFRDYLWVPLNGGGRVSKRRGLFNLFIVFVVSGLWHGAAWTFVVWGALHGAAVVVGNLTRRRRNKAWKRLEDWEAAVHDRFGTRAREVASVRAAGVPALRLPLLVPKVRHAVGIFVTVHAYALFGLFFIARSMGDVPVLVRSWFEFDRSNLGALILKVGPYPLLISVLALASLIAIEIFQGRHNLDEWIAARPWPVRWAIYVGGLLVILLFGAYGGQEFIYFQF